MSRSYKKHPHWTCRANCSKWFRRYHAKKVRKDLDISNGSAYKRLVCIWDLEDYKHVDFGNSIPDTWRVNYETGEIEIVPRYTEKYWRQAKGK